MIKNFEGVYAYRNDQRDLTDLGCDVIDWSRDNHSPFYKVTVKPCKDTRTALQNRYYWAIVRLITRWENENFDRWWEEDDTHRYLKSEYFTNPGELEEIMQELFADKLTTTEFIVRISGIMENTTTTDLDTKEFAQKIDRIRADYAKRGLYIQAPDEPPLSSYDN